MNEEIILQMVEPYVKDGSITYEEFDYLFPMLNRREQYAAVNVLAEHGIELRVSEEDADDLFQAELEGGEMPDEHDDSDIDIDLHVQYISSGNRSSSMSADDEDDDASYYMEDPDSEEEEEEDEQSEADSLDSTPYGETPLYDLNIFGGNDLKDYRFVLGKNIRQSNETLVRLFHEGHTQALEELCIKNQKLVMKYAIKYHGHNGNDLSVNDLFFAGVCGLIKAAKRFKFGMGSNFSTYAVHWIKQMIFREIADHGFTIRIPVHMYEKIIRISKLEGYYADQGLSAQERIKAIESDLAETNNPLTEEQILECIRVREQLQRCTSLDVPVGEDADTVLGDYVPSKRRESTEGFLDRMALRSELLDMLDMLSPREERVIRERFGLDGQKPKTLEEVGFEYKVTRERIRQIEKKALEKLKKICKRAGFVEYLEEMARWQ